MAKVRFNNVELTKSVGTRSLILPSPWLQATEQKLLSSDIEAEDRFGSAVSISADGNTAIVGANQESTDANAVGAAYIFTRSGDVWTEQQKIQASDKEAQDFFGWSVCISSDGNIVAVGAIQEGSSGSVYIFTRSGGVWTEQQKITPTTTSGARVGESVDISTDGSTLILGCRGGDQVFIYTYNGSSWVEEGIVTPDIPTNRFGLSVSLTSDGNIAVVGAPWDSSVSSQEGSVWIYQRIGTSWGNKIQKLTAPDAATSDQFGNSVNISDDGNTIFVGAYGDDTTATDAGSVYVYNRDLQNPTTWNFSQKIELDTATSFTWLGYTVSSSNDASKILITGYHQITADPIRTGAAYVYELVNGQYTNPVQLLASDREESDYFGWSSGISGDGNTVIVGAIFEDTGGNNAGATYVYMV